MACRSLVLLFILPLICLVSCAKTDRRQDATQSTSSSGVNVAEALSVVNRSDRAPNFSWKDSSGKITDFDSYRGRVTLVNFWATWCTPCRRELPDLIALSRDMADRNVKFIGISTDRGPNIIEDVRTFVKEHGVPYPIVVSNDDLEAAFGNPRLIPTSFLIDGDGKITQTIIGQKSKEFFSQAITSLLK